MSLVPVLPSHAVDPCRHLCDAGRLLAGQALSWPEDSPEQIARGKEFSAHTSDCRQCEACLQHIVLSACLIGCPQAEGCWEKGHFSRALPKEAGS